MNPLLVSIWELTSLLLAMTVRADSVNRFNFAKVPFTVPALAQSLLYTQKPEGFHVYVLMPRALTNFSVDMQELQFIIAWL